MFRDARGQVSVVSDGHGEPVALEFGFNVDPAGRAGGAVKDGVGGSLGDSEQDVGFALRVEAGGA